MTQIPRNLQTIESHILELQNLHPNASPRVQGHRGNDLVELFEHRTF